MSFSVLLQRFALLLFVVGFGIRPAAAQPTRYYTDRVITHLNTLNPTDATGHQTGKQAVLAPPALFGVASLKLGFANRNPTGSKAGLVVNSGGVLVLAALTGLVINTYLAPSTEPQQSIKLSQLLSLQVLNAGAATAEFTATKPFDQIELAAGGLLNAYTLGLVEAYADVPAPLPVSLVAFQGKATPGGVQLSWQTASELRNAYFAVERAANGEAATFAEIGRVAGAGSTSQGRSYQFTDAAPSPVGYYRLRQVDTDGQVHYSPLVVVQAAPASHLTAYPNPATSTLFVTSPSEVHLTLFNSQGQPLRRYELTAGQQTLEISNLPAGIYYLRDAATGQSTQFVKVGGQ